MSKTIRKHGLPSYCAVLNVVHCAQIVPSWERVKERCSTWHRCCPLTWNVCWRNPTENIVLTSCDLYPVYNLHHSLSCGNYDIDVNSPRFLTNIQIRTMRWAGPSWHVNLSPGQLLSPPTTITAIVIKRTATLPRWRTDWWAFDFYIQLKCSHFGWPSKSSTRSVCRRALSQSAFAFMLHWPLRCLRKLLSFKPIKLESFWQKLIFLQNHFTWNAPLGVCCFRIWGKMLMFPAFTEEHSWRHSDLADSANKVTLNRRTVHL